MVVRSYFYLAIGFNVQQQVSLLPLSNTPDNDGRQLSPITGSALFRYAPPCGFFFSDPDAVASFTTLFRKGAKATGDEFSFYNKGHHELFQRGTKE